MGPIAATLSCLRHPFKWSGRALPSEFWWFTLMFWLASFLATLPPMMPLVAEVQVYMAAVEQAQAEAYKNFGVPIMPPEPDFTLVMAPFLTYFTVLMILSIWPTLSFYAVLVRRLHDTGRSGWWYWISLVPFVGGLILLILLIIPSEIYKNTYGPPPGKPGPAPVPRGSDVPVVERNPFDDIRDADGLRALRQSRMMQ
ncbi:MAG: DUF805 domain-containing protein [Pseudomonadota bacterium]